VSDLDIDEPSQPTPGERLFYVLGQLYRRWQAGTTPTAPGAVDVEALARTLGVWPEVEFVQEEPEQGCLVCLHFPTEVLLIDHEAEFPWRLLGVWEWASEQEQKEMREGLDRWA
jgi:hypothetical protein